MKNFVLYTYLLLFNQRHVKQLSCFPKVIKGSKGAFLGPLIKLVHQFFAELVFITFWFSFYTCPRLHSGNHVKKDSLRSVSVYCRTLLLRQGFFFFPPTENPMFIFTKGRAPSTTPSWQPIPFCGILVFTSLLKSPAALHSVPCAPFLAAPTLSCHVSLENTVSYPSRLQLPAPRNQTCLEEARSVRERVSQTSFREIPGIDLSFLKRQMVGLEFGLF